MEVNRVLIDGISTNSRLYVHISTRTRMNLRPLPFHPKKHWDHHTSRWSAFSSIQAHPTQK